MTDELDVNPTKIALDIAQQPLGTGHDVMCSQCSGTIQEDDRAAFYAVERGDGTWYAARIMHQNCLEGTVFHREMVENPSRSTERKGEALGEGKVTYDPHIGERRPTENDLAREFGAMFGFDPDDVEVIQPRRREAHRLTDITITHVQEPGEKPHALDLDDD